jgi:hypothetical protein
MLVPNADAARDVSPSKPMAPPAAAPTGPPTTRLSLRPWQHCPQTLLRLPGTDKAIIPPMADIK